MQTNPEQWADDVRYLAKLVDWAAGEGFCQLKDMDDPEEWCFDKWNELKPDSNGDDYSADALAAALVASIQAAFAEREARLWTPPEEAWSGLARALMMAFDMECKTPRQIFQHLDRTGKAIPQWLRDEPEMQHLDHVPSKATRAVIIYRAMLEATLAPFTKGQQ